MSEQRLEPADYCRAIEAYLCRQNHGHLIRIVGPAFEQVCRWAEQGVPLKVAFRGIDRCVDRHHAKGPRRRPMRIEFCEADVLDVFDEWRRALGITTLIADGTAAVAGGGVHRSDGEEPPSRHPSLPAHLERVVARLTALRANPHPELDGVLESMTRELDAARDGARGLRGSARERFLARLRELDASLLTAAHAAVAPDARAELTAEAEAELAPFRARLPAEAWARSRAAAVDRLVREQLRLPVITYE